MSTIVEHFTFMLEDIFQEQSFKILSHILWLHLLLIHHYIFHLMPLKSINEIFSFAVCWKKSFMTPFMDRVKLSQQNH